MCRYLLKISVCNHSFAHTFPDTFWFVSLVARLWTHTWKKRRLCKHLATQRLRIALLKPFSYVPDSPPSPYILSLCWYEIPNPAHSCLCFCWSCKTVYQKVFEWWRFPSNLKEQLAQFPPTSSARLLRKSCEVFVMTCFRLLYHWTLWPRDLTTAW